MRPLTLDDLLPFDEYAPRRREFFEAHARYVDRYRRVRVGPEVTFLFENRQTLWFHVQELIRVARLSEHDLLQKELALHNHLLPVHDTLQAALVIDTHDDARYAEVHAFWKNVNGDEIRLCAGDHKQSADLVTCRPEDRCIGAIHWVQFAVDGKIRKALHDFRKPAYLEVMHDSYRHVSPAFSEDVRQSLLEDLASADNRQ